MVMRVIGQDITDEDGVASITYTPTGKGRIRIQAFSGDLQSNIYELIDAKVKDIKGEKTWTGSAYMSKSTSSDEYVELTSTATNQSTYYIDVPTTCTVFEFDLRLEAPSEEEISTVIRFATSNGTNIGTFYQSNIHLEEDRWYHIKVTTDGSKWYMYLDYSSDVYYSINKTGDLGRFYFLINANLNTVIKYKNFVCW